MENSEIEKLGEEYLDFGEAEDMTESRETEAETIAQAVSSVSMDGKSDDTAPESQVTVGSITFDFGDADSDTELRNRTVSLKDKHTKAEQRAMNIQSFNSAIRNHWSGRGTVATVTTKEYGDREMPCLTLIAEAGFRVFIPYEEVFPRDPITTDIDLSTREGRARYRRRQEQVLEKLMDTQVRFVPTELFELENGSVGVLASRKLALADARIRSFVGSSRRPPRYKVNDIVQANIVSVGNSVMRIELGGYETSMRRYFLTDYHIRNLKTDYAPGGTVPVLIERIEPITDESGRISDVSVSLSGFKAEVELDRDNLELVSIGDKVNVRLSKVVKKGDPEAPYYNFIGCGESVKIHAKIERLNTLGIGTPPEVGDLVTIRVRDVDKHGDGYIHGFITAIHRGTAKNG